MVAFARQARRQNRCRLPKNLRLIHDSVSELITQFSPTEFAIEQVFMAKNPDSALKLGQARGAAIVAAARAGLPVAEYSARQIKQAVVGNGGAEKEQVQHMVVALLNLQKDTAGRCSRCTRRCTMSCAKRGKFAENVRRSEENRSWSATLIL